MDESQVFAFMNEEMKSVLEYTNGSFYARFKEDCTMKCALNRSIRIRLINEVLFADENGKGFAKWIDHKEMSCFAPCDVLCICGQHLTAESYYVARKHPLLGIVRACIGGTCIQQLDVLHETTTYEQINNFRMTCSNCGKRKNKVDQVCKKCFDERELAAYLKRKSDQDQAYLKRKFDDEQAHKEQYMRILEQKLLLQPSSTFLNSLMSQLRTKGKLSEKQLGAILK